MSFGKKVCFWLLMWAFQAFNLVEALEEPPYEVISDKSKTKILSPIFAKQRTERIRLKNGLQAYLISDPLTDKSGAAIGINTGTWENPALNYGMAH